MNNIIIHNNNELVQVVTNCIKQSGITKTFLADKLGLTRQGLDKMLQKKSFSLDDANKILSLLNKKVIAQLENE